MLVITWKIQTNDYINEKLRGLNQTMRNIDHDQLSATKSIDQNNLESGFKSRVAGGEGFEPSTPNLGGWCSIREDIKTLREPPFVEMSSIRAELLALSNNSNSNFDINTLLRIEKVALYLEGKGR
jgi:hypothetical protein